MISRYRYLLAWLYHDVLALNRNEAAGLYLTKKDEVKKSNPIQSTYAEIIHDVPDEFNGAKKDDNMNKEVSECIWFV